MSRACNKFDAQALDVVIGIVQGMDLQFTAAALTRIDMADSQRAAKMAQDSFLKLLPIDA